MLKILPRDCHYSGSCGTASCRPREYEVVDKVFDGGHDGGRRQECGVPYVASSSERNFAEFESMRHPLCSAQADITPNFDHASSPDMPHRGNNAGYVISLKTLRVPPNACLLGLALCWN